MMYFGKVFTVAAVVLLGIITVLGQPTARAPAMTTPDNVIEAIQAVTVESSQLQVAIYKLNMANFLSQGGIIASGLGKITKRIAQFTSTINTEKFNASITAAQAFPDDAAQEIVAVLTTFVEVHQFLLSTIIGKQSLAQRFFLTRPIAVALRSLEGVVDAFAFALIGLIPTQKSAAETQFNELGVTFREANDAYPNN